MNPIVARNRKLADSGVVRQEKRYRLKGLFYKKSSRDVANDNGMATLIQPTERNAIRTSTPHIAAKRDRLLIVQFGNYAEAVHRFARGGEENYHHQRYSVEYVAGLAAAGYRIKVIAIGEDAELEELPNGIAAQGLLLYRQGRFHRPPIKRLIQIAEDWRPTRLLLRIPLAPVVRWAVSNRIDTLPLLADSFRATGFRRQLGYLQLASALNHPAIRWVANHGPSACEDLIRIGVNPTKVLPFDWPQFDWPSKWPAKKAPANPRAVCLTYVGQIKQLKGVGDLIDAIAVARSRGENYRAVLIGSGADAETLQAKVNALGLSGAVIFCGQLSRDRAIELLHEGDVAVVPSRHEYPEGLPQTLYEGLLSRAPLATSDHPMFALKIAHERNAVVFRASNPESLYQAVHNLVNHPELYERLSRESDRYAGNFHGPLKWDQLITRWLKGTADDHAWLRQHAMAR